MNVIVFYQSVCVVLMKQFIILADTRFLLHNSVFPNYVTGFIQSNVIQKIPKPFKLIKCSANQSPESAQPSSKTYTKPIKSLLTRCSHNSWIVVINNSNVILPDCFWNILETECTDKHKVYGVDYTEYLDLEHYKNQKPIQHIYESTDPISITGGPSVICIFYYSNVIVNLPNITTRLPVNVDVLKIT